MLCDNCKTNSATFHYTHSENGVVIHMHLCSECAKKIGLSSSSSVMGEGLFAGKSIFDEISSNAFSPFFTGYQHTTGTLANQKICPGCGMSEREFRKYGKFGCKECYNTFSDLCLAILQKIHSSNEYKGKRPTGICENASTERKIEKLREDMQKAVQAQEYENAAKIRDAIRLLEDNIKEYNNKE